MSTVLQSRLPFAPWADPRTRRLPGIIPLDMADWLDIDDAYAGQMALRDGLIAERPKAVHALAEAARPAAEELYGLLLPLLPGLGFSIGPGTALRPDGVTVPLDPSQPLLTLGRLVQEDLMLMLPGPPPADGLSAEHVLAGAVLCFPAGWTLAEKFGQPMGRIHVPVAIYTEDVARRVQRLLDGVQPGRPLVRGTAHHSNAPLFNPRTEAMGRAITGDLPFLRVERQCLLRLPQSRAVVFSVHTYVLRPEALSAEQAALLREFPIRHAA
ncbi:DUF3445 domain-containing protein [Frigidibacter albus]|uniref:DUF3445 domain-containing protein n=1 Tax=Frigidibacter albus TaxID=1465486 RepID=A0A6L8VGB3_9RHOB|nr:DUF3445 domain-containing protein [Frigidibacter albus]MZQ88349.1 DUF3445 domain-containing protein [Frigidibacter albus]NBE29977.1 DUF3445 domain-containing protein [Frigidibacter albus]GGH45919.1 hypothetical protein GCM10011341_06080 [Frigidibacter albus]